MIPPTDAVIGRLLQLGVSRCPELGKAWSQFASWCYRWGRRVVDAASEAGGQLSEVDRVAVQQMMPPGISADDLDKVYFILSQTRAVADEEDIEVRFVMFAGYKVATQAVLSIITSSVRLLRLVMNITKEICFIISEIFPDCE